EIAFSREPWPTYAGETQVITSQHSCGYICDLFKRKTHGQSHKSKHHSPTGIYLCS
ncbi:hypothetical protein ANANG_G00113990, partial [Anguilla anguilla]